MKKAASVVVPLALLSPMMRMRLGGFTYVGVSGESLRPDCSIFRSWMNALRSDAVMVGVPAPPVSDHPHTSAILSNFPSAPAFPVPGDGVALPTEDSSRYPSTGHTWDLMLEPGPRP